MIRMFVRHPVEDFDDWKQVYDDFAGDRREMGVVDDAVFRSVEDPDDVTVWHDFEDEETARSFVESDRLREVMEDAGVAGDPTIWFTTPA